MDKIKVLYVINGFAASDGVSSFVKTYYQNMNLNKFQLDFMTIANQPCNFENIVKSNNSIIHSLKPIKESMYKFYKEVNRVLDENNYDIVHVHILGPAAFFVLRSAHKKGINKIIWHSHNTKNGDTFLGAKRNDVLAKLSIKYANTFFACSKEASFALFGNYDANIIKNAIDLDKFQFNKNDRTIIRKQLNIDNNHVVGIVARFALQKNPFFIIDIAKSMVEFDPLVKFVWIGEGALKNDVANYISELGLDKYVLLLEAVDDVQRYYNAFDLFLLPSKFEGLGIVYIESQANGLPTIASDAVPKDTKLTNLITYIPLEDDSKKWANIISEEMKNIKDRTKFFKQISESEYDIKRVVMRMEEYYEK